MSSALCLTFLRNSLRLLSWAASRFRFNGVGRVGREANLLLLLLLALPLLPNTTGFAWYCGWFCFDDAYKAAGVGEDWRSTRQALGSRGERGGVVMGDDKGDAARTGLEDRGEETVGR